MGDPLSVAAAVLAIITATAQSTKLLHETVQSYKSRDKTLKKLDDELKDVVNILDSLAQVNDIDAKLWALLKDPITRCSQVCCEFEQSMKTFAGKSKTGLRDWTKMEFMKGNINDFIDQITGYKSTITVGLGIITMHTSRVTHEFLQEYTELTKDTSYSLEMQLQRIDEKLEVVTFGKTRTSDMSIDLNDERAVTKQCLQICEDAKSFIESLTKRESALLPESSRNAAEELIQNAFEAQLSTRQALDENRDRFAEIIGRLRQRLENLVLDGDPENDKERLQLQKDINVSKQCLEVCKVATEVSQRKVHIFGETITGDDSDQVVVTTVADLFDVKKVVSGGRSVQLVGSITPENFRDLAEKRYNSRFGALVAESAPTGAGATRSPSSAEALNGNSNRTPPTASNEEHQGLRTSRAKPFPNEMRKRFTKDDTNE